MNKDMLSFLKGVLTIAVLLLLSTPLILMNVFQGELSGPWIGFWGSFSGGILGTAGVIYVAYIQSKQQRELNKDSMEEQRSLNNQQIQFQIDSMKIVEKNNKERLRIETQIKMLESYIEDINNLTTEIFELKTMLLELIYFKKLFDAYDKSEASETDEDLRRKKEYFDNQYRLTKDKFKIYNPGYFLTALSDIAYRNEVLSHEDVVLNAGDFGYNKVDPIVKTRIL